MALYRDLQVVGWSQSLQVGCSFPGWHLELREHLCGSHWMRRFWTFSLRTGYWDLEKRWNPEAVTSWSGVPVGIKEGRSLKCVCFCVHWFPGELPSHYSEAALEFRLSPPSQGQTAQIEKQTWTSLGSNTNTHTQFGDRILSVTPEFGPSPPWPSVVRCLRQHLHSSRSSLKPLVLFLCWRWELGPRIQVSHSAPAAISDRLGAGLD